MYKYLDYSKAITELAKFKKGVVENPDPNKKFF
jgi:hypothetical protein